MTASPAAAVFARDGVLACCDSLEQRLRDLLEGPESIAAGVHEVRKLAKVVRGGMALFRLESSGGREIQAIGRLLSGMREAASRQAAWERLAWEQEAEVTGAVNSLLGKESAAASLRPPGAAIAWCLERVAAARRDLRKLPAKTLTASFRRGLARLDRRLREHCRRLEDGGESGFHETRKAAKAWMGAQGFLPPALRRDHPSLERLAKWLGEENDLASLSGWLEAHGFTKRLVPGLWKKLEQSRRRLQRRAIRHLPRSKS